MVREKRQYPRLEKQLPVKIATNTADLVAQTKNLSCNGAYCTFNKELPLMTKLKVTILLPQKKNKIPQKSIKVQCVGIIVRTTEISEKEKRLYNTAIFFEQIRDREREKLQDYINQLI